MKRFVIMIFCIALLSQPVHGSAHLVDQAAKVYDHAELFTDDQKTELQDLSARVVLSHQIDAIILTTDDDEGKASGDYAADFYEQNDFGVGQDNNGVLLLLNMDKREVFFLTVGSANQVFLHDDVEYMLDLIYEQLADGRYGEAAEIFLREIDNHYQYLESGHYDAGIAESHGAAQQTSNLPKVAGLSVLGGAVAAALIILVMYLIQRNSLPGSPSYHAYLGDGSVQLRRETDRFVSTHTTRTAIPKNNNGGGGGRGGPTTFRSSGGSSYGGGGRKF